MNDKTYIKHNSIPFLLARNDGGSFGKFLIIILEQAQFSHGIGVLSNLGLKFFAVALRTASFGCPNCS
jgi:hypothetical protein